MRHRKKITKIRLYHFQAHVDTVLYFDPVSNAIIGATDVGKSAITRALYWVLYNKPVRIGHPGTPDEFTTWGEKHCFVTITFDDGTEITRGRKNKENYYVLVNSDGTKTSFKGFGFDIPQAILDAHGMYPLVVDDTEMSLNVTQQHDSIFMLEDGASLRAKVVGKLSGADKADGAIGVVNAWYRSAQSMRQASLNEIKELDAAIDSYSFVDDLDKAIHILNELLQNVSMHETLAATLASRYYHLLQLEAHKKNIMAVVAYDAGILSLDQLVTVTTELQVKALELHNILGSFLATKKERRVLDLVLSEADKLHAVDVYVSETDHQYADFNSMINTLYKYRSIEAELASISFLLSKTDGLETTENLISELQHITDLYSNILNSFFKFDVLQKRMQQEKGTIRAAENNLQNLTEIYKETLSAASVCPFCFSEITEEQLMKIHD